MGHADVGGRRMHMDLGGCGYVSLSCEGGYLIPGLLKFPWPPSAATEGKGSTERDVQMGLQWEEEGREVGAWHERRQPWTA